MLDIEVVEDNITHKTIKIKDKFYEVYNNGDIESHANQKLVGSVLPNGYKVLTVNYNHKNYVYYIHRIIATLFIENDDVVNKKEVNHIDRNKTNNDYRNLKWCTPKENSGKANNIRVYKYDLKGNLEICNNREDLKKRGFTPQIIYKCCQGIRNSHKGFIFSDYALTKKELEIKIAKAKNSRHYANNT